MATQPTETLLWCTDTTDSDANLLKVAPPESVKTTGLLRGSPFARVWHNFYFNYLCESVAWLFDDVYAVGSVVMFETAAVPNFGNWKGTWSNIGSQSIGGRTIEYYERTA